MDSSPLRNWMRLFLFEVHMPAALLNGVGFDTVRLACDAMPDSSTSTVQIPGSLVGSAGFGLIAKTTGFYTIEGLKQPDGKYPTLIALGTTERLTYGKAIINIEGPHAIVQNLTISGAQVSLGDGGNGASIRVNAGAKSVVMRNVHCVASQDGLLADGTAEQTILGEDCTFKASGFGRQGYTHNIYAGLSKSFTLRRTTVADSPFGHDIKSRSLATYLYQVHAEGSKDGRELDVSNGGILYAEDCNFIKHADAAQNNLIHIAPEGIPDTRPESYKFVRCLFQIDIPNNGRALQFVNNGGRVPCVLIDPLFKMAGAVMSADAAKSYFVGDVRIELTGGPLGPSKPVGYQAETAVAPAPVVAPTPAPIPAPAPATAWVRVGNEGSIIGCKIGDTFRYGIPGKWVTKTMEVTTFIASNTTFGSDPAVGIAKVVEVQVASTVPVIAPLPAPLPAPAPAPAPLPAPVPVPTTTPTANATFADAYVIGSVAMLRALGFTVTR